MAYGSNGRRMGLHKEGQKQHGFWCDDLEWHLLCVNSAHVDMTVSQFIRAIARGEIEVRLDKYLKQKKQ